MEFSISPGKVVHISYKLKVNFLQHFIRGTIVFTKFGNVNEAAMEMKSLLQIDMKLFQDITM